MNKQLTLFNSTLVTVSNLIPASDVPLPEAVNSLFLITRYCQSRDSPMGTVPKSWAESESTMSAYALGLH